MKHLVKRKGHTEIFDDRKIYASVYAACLSLRMTQEEGELIAEMVTSEVADVVKDFHEVDAHTIHKHVVVSLNKFNPDAAYLYDTHKDIF